MKPRSFCILGCAAIGLVAAHAAWSQTIAPAFSGSYTLTDLGSIASLPTPYGGLTLKAGDTNTLLIGGTANNPGGGIYSVGVVRGAGNHITGFSGPASYFAEAPYIDGGLTYGPGGVLFFTEYPVNKLGQIKPGSSAPDKTTDLTTPGVYSSVGSIAFAPNGDAKVLSYNGDKWYTVGLSPDGSGTYNVGPVTLNSDLIGGGWRGLEGAVYVPAGSPVFTPGSILVAEYGAGQVGTYLSDGSYNPIPGTRQTFISGLTGAEGSYIDPLTGDFLFSTFGGGNHVIRVSGFSIPEPPIPSGVPDSGSTAALLATTLAALALMRRRFT